MFRVDNGLASNGIGSMKDENKQLEKILKVNGIGLPPVPPERPEARPFMIVSM